MTATISGPVTANPGVQAPSFDELASRADDALREVVALDEPARSVALAAKDAIEALHRHALVTIVKALKADYRGRDLLFGLVDDPSVRAVLTLHGIMRPDPAAAVLRVLAQVRPYLQAEGADATLVRMDGDVAILRLEGTLTGCNETAQALRHELEDTLAARVPELGGIDAAPAEPERSFIPLASLRRKGE